MKLKGEVTGLEVFKKSTLVTIEVFGRCPIPTGSIMNITTSQNYNKEKKALALEVFKKTHCSYNGEMNEDESDSEILIGLFGIDEEKLNEKT